MNLFKVSILTVFAAVIFAGCNTAVAPIISTPIENIDVLPIKISPLTEAQYKNWMSADLIQDTIPGMSVDRAYTELLNKRKGQTVIVAVLDSGVDIEHEDLKGVIWENEGEIPGNGIDDDRNGYVDDVHGWNFLGDIIGENMEYVRYIKKLGPKFEDKSESSISATDRADYEIYLRAMAEFEKDYQQALSNKLLYQQINAQVKPAHEAMAKKLGTETYTEADLNAISNPTVAERQQIGILLQMLSYGDPVTEVIKQLDEGIAYFGGRLDTHFNFDESFRNALGDDPDDFSSKFYGNNDVDGPDPKKKDAMHGTHVSGIIAAKRDNGIGMNGVAKNVKIMPVRVVPDGDEYDKDIALGIRYAVDNGAKVINASFGKEFSPHPEWVRDAIKYAESKDVLLVIGSGNDGVNTDLIISYPNDQEKSGPEISENVLVVGAINYKYGSELVANFSNYGKSSVDVFAPGVKIYSCTPLNTYEFQQGTSMAAPAVAGIAASIRSFYPSLSAKQVKQIIMESGLTSNTAVVLPGDPSKQDKFSNISKSGKMANLFNALIMADKLSRI